jgi:hypothetical protein
MAIERQMRLDPSAPGRREKVHERLDAITRAVTELKTPASFGDQLYVLRDHVAAVRRRLDQEEGNASPAPVPRPV